MGIFDVFKKEEEMVKFNGLSITKKQLHEKKKEISQQKGITLQEVSKGVFRTRIQG